MRTSAFVCAIGALCLNIAAAEEAAAQCVVRGPVGLTADTPEAVGTTNGGCGSTEHVRVGPLPAPLAAPAARAFQEAKLRGATIAAIKPSVEPDVGMADIWVPVRPGTDAA